MRDNCHIGVVIATKDRPYDLQRTLGGLELQTKIPDLVVVCDSSELSKRDQVKRVVCESSLRILLVETSLNSLTRQKNLAIETMRSNSQVEYIQILDDDTIPDRCYVEKMIRLLTHDACTVGVSGITFPFVKPYPPQTITEYVLRLCGLYSRKQGVVTSAGIGIPVRSTSTEVVHADWLIGCSMWKTFVFDQLKYENDFMGSGLFEDVVFSVRARKLGHLLVDPTAILNHESSPTNRPTQYLESYRFVRNRLRVVRYCSPLRGIVSFPISTIVFLGFLMTRGREGFEAAKGLLRGVWEMILFKPLK